VHVNVEKQIARLESLLGRIRQNAALPRAAGGAVAAAPSPGEPVREEPVPFSAMPATARADVPEASPPAAVAEASVSTEFEEMDMMDAELVEVAPEGAAPELPAEEADLGADLVAVEEEPVPESAPRAAPAFAGEADLEPPVKTPPPESGRQVMMQPPSPSVSYQEEVEEAELGGAADVDSLLEADLSGGPISKAPPGMPTMEQLGDIVELEGADAPAALLELAATGSQQEEEAPLDDLELALPKQEFGGGYSAELPPPPDAAADLERHRQAMERQAAPATSEFAVLASIPAGAPSVPAISATPLVVERPVLDVPQAAQIIVAAAPKIPDTFLELLDASLSLRA
jgi:hypothetical protein